jgi:hypothetical protein
MTPFTMTGPSQFRPGPPPDLMSALYAADVNEVKAIGGATSATRTAEQTNVALLWAAFNTADLNDLARSVLPPHLQLVDEARVLALVDFALGDGAISTFDAKITYNFWRPYHAIRLAASAGNPAITPDPAWTSLVQPTPNFQDYTSAHATYFGAALRMLANLFGDDFPIVVSSVGFSGSPVTYSSFSDADLGDQNARVWGGLHFRNSCVVGSRMGNALADYIFANFLTPRDDDDGGDDDGGD